MSAERPHYGIETRLDGGAWFLSHEWLESDTSVRNPHAKMTSTLAALRAENRPLAVEFRGVVVVPPPHSVVVEL